MSPAGRGGCARSRRPTLTPSLRPGRAGSPSPPCRRFAALRRACSWCGRASGAAGGRFNLGEATVARATVRLHGGPLAAEAVGTCYLLGTDLEHARLAAIFDGLLADTGLRERVLAEVIAPLEQTQAERDRTRDAEARGTVVDFFSVAREHE